MTEVSFGDRAREEIPLDLREALAMVGWGNYDLVDAEVLGTRQLVACTLDESEHHARVADGRPPVVDPFLFRCVAHEDPAFVTRRSPVHVAGAVAVRRCWTSARRNLGGFRAFGARVAVLPPREARRPGVATEAIVTGFGVLARDADQSRLVHHPDVRAVSDRTWVHRLVEEALYDALVTAPDLDDGVAAPHRRRMPATPTRPRSSTL